MKSKLADQDVAHGAVERVLHDMAAELDADVTPDEQGALQFTFPAIRKQFLASETVRNKLRLENRALGEIVYDTSDSAEQAGERELSLFDRQLEGDASLDRYLPTADRIDFEDEFELVAFDEQLQLRKSARR